jgi:hypothetical protein
MEVLKSDGPKLTTSGPITQDFGQMCCEVLRQPVHTEKETTLPIPTQIPAQRHYFRFLVAPIVPLPPNASSLFKILEKPHSHESTSFAVANHRCQFDTSDLSKINKLGNFSLTNLDTWPLTYLWPAHKIPSVFTFYYDIVPSWSVFVSELNSLGIKY